MVSAASLLVFTHVLGVWATSGAPHTYLEAANENTRLVFAHFVVRSYQHKKDDSMNRA